MANIASSHNGDGSLDALAASHESAGATSPTGPSHSPEALLTFKVSVLASTFARLVDTSVQKTLELTSRQWRVLVVLNKLGASTSGEIARAANFDHSQVSRVAFELAKKGLISQADDAQDRRKQRLLLTPFGVERLRKGIPYSLEREARLRSRLTADEYAIFSRTLVTLNEEATAMLDEVRVAQPDA